MRTYIIAAIAVLLVSRTDAQYRPEAQASQDALVGQRVWRSPPFPMEGSRIMYTERVEAAGLSEEMLFKNALEWYNYNYKSADTRLTIEKPAEGRISGTGLIKYTAAAAEVPGEVPIIFHFDLYINEGAYTYRFYDMYGIDASGRFDYADMYREDSSNSTQIKPRWTKRYRYELLSDLNTMVEMAIAHLKQAMIKESALVTK